MFFSQLLRSGAYITSDTQRAVNVRENRLRIITHRNRTRCISLFHKVQLLGYEATPDLMHSLALNAKAYDSAVSYSILSM